VTKLLFQILGVGCIKPFDEEQTQFVNLSLGFLTQAHWLQSSSKQINSSKKLFNSTKVFALNRFTTKEEIPLQPI